MFNPKPSTLTDLDAHQLHQALMRNDVVLVDVREPDEHQAGRIAGAVNVPLSAFDPKALPQAQGKTIVLHCAGGGRSARALDICRRHGVDVRHHLSDGLNAWKAAGLPVIR